jgi:putative transposase
LSITAKVALVRQVRGTWGLGPALSALGLARSTWHYRQHVVPYELRHAALRVPLERIARRHPAYGYRRATPELRDLVGRPVNHKVVRRLQRLWDVPLLRLGHGPRPSGIRQILTAAGPRANLVASLARIGPLQVFYTDFTELRYATGKAWLMTLLDHASKVVIGWAVGGRADTALATMTWRRARRWLEQHHVVLQGLIVHHDRDSVYTSYQWLGLLQRDRVRPSFALHGCRDNPEMESFHSRFKTENRSLLLDASTLSGLTRIVQQRIRYYNARRRHSALHNQAPLTFLASYGTES